MTNMSCFVIGGNTLMMECCEHLLERGHTLSGVISADERVQNWAHSREIVHFHPKDRESWLTAMKADPFDVLFSIAYLAVVPEEALELPHRGAINFHDGPLPNYAGLNTPAWALLSGESEYGITWHTMTARVDQGDILIEKRFEVSPRDTSLTLNTRCFEVALESFRELLSLLVSDRLTPRVQELTGFKYFGRHDRPDAACWLDFNQKASHLANLVRALDFGPYQNPLGSPKTKIGDEVVIVRQAEMREGVGAPGSVISLDRGELVVGTGEDLLAITQITDLAGRNLSLEEFREGKHLQTGDRLFSFDTIAAKAWTASNQGLARGEAFWAGRLARVDSYDLPFSGQGNGGPAGFLSRKLEQPAELKTPEQLATFSAFLARTAGLMHFHLGYQDDSVRRECQGQESWIADVVPLKVAFKRTMTFPKLCEAMTRETQRIHKHKTWLRDLIARRPELQANTALLEDRAFPALFTVVEDDETYTPSDRHALVLAVSPHGATLYLRNDIYNDAGLEALAQCYSSFLANLLTQNEGTLGEISLLNEGGRDQILRQWNATQTSFRSEMRVHELFEEAVNRTPEAIAAVHRDQQMTYAQLDAAANRLARHLQKLGIGPDCFVGIHLTRSTELMVAILAAQKAGGAYLPLDPTYPRERIHYMIEDSAVKVIISQSDCVTDLPGECPARIIVIDRDQAEIANYSPDRLQAPGDSTNLAYIIYTSGSTGKPKGVMVPHRTVINFFVGMDARIPHQQRGTWLAVTSLSFDISVLELFWTLSHGFKVVIYEDTTNTASSNDRGMDFSLFYFSNSESAEQTNKFRLLLEGAKWADQHEFCAVWTPERHFHDFGGLYPHPAVTGAAVAAITQNVGIRAGSLVVPLHHPARIAETWSVVDNISNGRVGLACASGWAPTDFLLMPENFKNPKGIMFANIEKVKRLWRGEAVSFPGATGESVEVKTLPHPVQKELPIWITTAGNIETYTMAGSTGANVLTHLLGQSIEQLEPKIKAYRDARKAAGFDPESGIVSLMLHTFVGYDEDFVREQVRGPLKGYLSSSMDLLKKYAWAFPAFSRPKDVSEDPGDDFANLSDEEKDAILDGAFERYYETSGLFGHPDNCLRMVDALKGIGVDEIACLIDFGVPTDLALKHLEPLDEVRKRANLGKGKRVKPAVDPQKYGFPALVEHHRVTHMQCTPSMAQMLTTHTEMNRALSKIPHLFIGGEALPAELARKLVQTGAETVMNMYGPTETTIWSTTQSVKTTTGNVPIGQPIANTEVYVLDPSLQPLPPGAAGELYIAGDGVTRGYHDRPALTATRFVPDPFGRTGAAMYRTGDLVRWNRDGILEFLGRVDFQVKLRGFRIELGEIEARLARHEHIAEVVVMAREDQPGDIRLVAYLVPKEEAPSSEDLRHYLRDQLPEYMIPGHFAVMECFPLTPNKKIDRKALPAPDAARTKSKVAYVPPENETETKITDLWAELLGREQVGIDDNFFDIGGHSLLVVRMHRMLEKALERSIMLTDLYRFTTVRALSAYLTKGGDTDKKLKQSAERAQRRLAARRRR